MTTQFEEGQVVYMEYIDNWFPKPSSDRKLIKGTVVKFNKTSVYVISDRVKNDYPDWESRKHLLDRFTIKSLTGKNAFDTIKLWLTEDDFNKSVEAQIERSRIRKEAREKFDRQKISKLKMFLEDENYD